MTKIAGRMRLGIIMFALLAVLPYVGVIRGMSADLPARQPEQSYIAWMTNLSARDVPTKYEKKLASLRDALPQVKQIGFISDENISISEYYMAQYALAPLIVRHDANSEWVICAFHNPQKKQKALQSGVLKHWLAIDFRNSQRIQWRLESGC
jgi:hypothetical protein